jgi:hypothetical protein
VKREPLALARLGSQQASRLTSWAPRAAARRLAWLDARACATAGLPLLLYILTLAPTVYNLDSAELTTAAATGGLVRSTGYPLYLLLGRLCSFLPVGDVGYRLNLLSAVCGALTLLLADRVLRHLRVGGWAAAGALGLLAVSPFFWGLSLVAEVYTLHSALMAALILALLRWSEQPTPGRLGVVGLLAGLGLAHHLAMALLLPGAAVFVLASAPRQALTPRASAAAVGGLLAGLSLYLYLPLLYLAQPAFNYAGLYDTSLRFVPVNLLTVEGLAWLVTGRAFAGQMFGYQGAELWVEARHFVAQLGQAFFAVGLGPGLLGLLLLARRNWRQAGLLLLMFAATTAFYVDYRVLDKETMYLPSYLVWAVWVGLGYQALLDWVTAPAPTAMGSRWRAALGALMLGAVALAVGWNWRLVNLSGDWSARQRAEAILREVEPNAILFGWWDTVPAVQYLQLVEGWRPDVLVVNRFLISPDDMRRAIEREVAQRPIYIAGLVPEMSLDATVENAGSIYRLVQGTAGIEPDGHPTGRGRKPARKGPDYTIPNRAPVPAPAAARGW